jgi:type IV pilus assembly protein PilM
MKALKDIFTSLASSSSTVPGAVGIDIGSSSIKVVELQEKEGVVTLSTYGELQLGPYAAKDLGAVVTLQPKEEQEALVDVIRESAVTMRSAVFAMPLSSSFVTNVGIEAEAEADLAPMVRVEARKVIPASLSEVTLDWAEVEQPEHKTDTVIKEKVRRDVLIAAIQNNALERFKVLMQFAGFRQPPTEIECFSTIRSLFDSAVKHAAIIDVGAASTKLYIMRDGLLMRMHRVRAGGMMVSETLMTQLSVSFEEAEKRKQTVGRKDAQFPELKRHHDHVYDRAFREFNQVLREYEQKTGATIGVVYVTGGAALFPSFVPLVKDALRKEVMLADPFAKVSYPAFMGDVLKQIGPSFTVALGAALRSFE